MLSGLEITCANKNQNGTIVRIGGSGWSMSQTDAIRKLIMNHITLNISIGDETFQVRVAGEGQDTYLVLEPGGKLLSEVEQLLSC